MRFEKLIIENFSSYYGKHTIDFNAKEEKPVTIIVGGSGYGKTSIFDALNWALYGSQYETVLEEQHEKSIADYANETAIKSAAKVGESIEMACTLHFEHEGVHYRIQQAISAKQSKDKVEITDRLTTLYEINPSGNHKEIGHVDLFLNEILPSNVRDYFLFNGDRINKLALPGSSKEIRDGIYRVVDLELLQNGVEHLKDAAKKFRRSTKESSKGEMAEIETQFSAAHDALEDWTHRKTELNEDRIALEARVEIVDSKLRGMQGIIDLQKKRDHYKYIYETKENDLKQTIVELRSIAAIASTGMVLDDIKNLEKVLGEKRKKGEIPSSISEHLLRDLIEMGKCICGTEFTPQDKIYKELNQRLKQEIEKQSKGQGLDELYFELRSTSTHIKEAQSKLLELEKRRSTLEKAKVEAHKQLEDALQKLINTPDEDISKLATDLKQLNSELTGIKLDIQSAQTKMKEKEEQIQKLKSRRDELGKQQENVRKQQLRDSLAQSSAEELERIFEKFAEDSRLEIEKLTRDEFQKFIPTANALSVGIDAEFHYDVKDQNGNPALQQLSNGQKQALSLAYITSISRVSEKNPPLVIDMPFGRLDKDVQDNIASRLPNLASQVVLLMLPGSEWNEHTKSILKSKSSDIYELSFDEKKRQTNIQKG